MSWRVANSMPRSAKTLSPAWRSRALVSAVRLCLITNGIYDTRWNRLRQVDVVRCVVELFTGISLKQMSNSDKAFPPCGRFSMYLSGHPSKDRAAPEPHYGLQEGTCDSTIR